MRQRKCLRLSRNNLTIIHTYYNEQSLLETQIERWNVYNQPINIILIDDGSQKVPAIDVIKQHTLKDYINFSLYRVTEDIGFNSHGCRNLGARLANTDWLVFLDIDYTIQPSDLARLKEDPLDPDSWYEMNAKFHGRGDSYMALNQFVIPKKMFLEHGGYDESFVPFHFGDRDLLNRLASRYNKKNLDWLILTCRRGGRKAIIDENAEIPIYDDENMVFYTKKLDESKLKRIDTKINFEWTQLL
ncbi:glycosyltransferase family 2 protein [bacterium]|nr:glycosyltransferase family 2 protein [bacterium]